MASEPSENPIAASFVRCCDQWLCDGYSTDIRYLAVESAGGAQLVDAQVLLNPLPHAVDYGLELSTSPLSAGQEQVASVSKERLLAIVRQAVAGSVAVNGKTLTLPTENAYQFHPAVAKENSWFIPLTLKICGSTCAALGDRNAVDSALRAGSPPFDGAEDLSIWLGLRLPDGTSLGTITVVVNPPVDFLLDRSRLLDGNLHLVFLAHPNADRSQVRVAIREIPGEGLSGRTHVAHRIVWGEAAHDRVEGTADVTLTNANSVLAMLLIGPETVRRQWFLDLSRAPNHRYAAVHQFDTDLRMIRRGLFDELDSTRFEMAISALLFLLGFSSSIQLETNSPDLIVATPNGRIVVVECTTRVADVPAKIGKLVDRREALQSKLRADSTWAEVVAVLVCRLPRDQIAAHVDDMKTMRIVLASGEDIRAGLDRAPLINNADELLDSVLRTLNM